MEDIRAIEKETAEMLRKTMAGASGGNNNADEDGEYKAGYDLEANSSQLEITTTAPNDSVNTSNKVNQSVPLVSNQPSVYVILDMWLLSGRHEGHL